MINNVIVLFFTVVLFVLVFLVYGYLLVRKLMSKRITAQKRRWMDEHLPAMEDYLVTGQLRRVLRPYRDYQYEALEDYFSDYLSVYKVDPERNLVGELVERTFTDRYRKQLKHGKWSVRMNTLYFIQLFKLGSMKEDLLRLLGSHRCSAEEEFEIYILLAEFGTDNLVDLYAKSKRHIPTFLLNQMMIRLVTYENFDRYAESFDSLPYDWRLSVLDIIRHRNFRSFTVQELLERLLAGNDRELRLRAIKTIAYLGYISSTEIITRYWEEMREAGAWDGTKNTPEKLLLARLMGSIPYPVFIPILETLIADPAYSVRTEAAHALRRYKDGKRHLQTIADSHPDAFARNMAREWLERGLAYE